MDCVIQELDVRTDRLLWEWHALGHVPLSEVANLEKKLPRDYITENGFGITESCRRYLQPLIGGEAYPPYRDGLPEYVHIKGVPVGRKLTTDFKV